MIACEENEALFGTRIGTAALIGTAGGPRSRLSWPFISAVRRPENGRERLAELETGVDFGAEEEAERAEVKSLSLSWACIFSRFSEAASLRAGGVWRST
jgi:hypothetical protein